MSVSALTWAFAQEVSPTTKLVLLALADYANENLEAYPSVAALKTKTCLNRKSIFLALERLKQIGLIEPTGERKGTTKQIHIYRLKASLNRNSSEIGTVPKTDRKSPKNGPLKESLNRDTEPSVLLTVNEPSVPPNPQKVDVLAAFEHFWAEILPANRKGKGRAREEFQKAIKNGVDVEDILAGVASFRKTERKRAHQNDYRPLLPATWLHQTRWEDDIVIEQDNGDENWVNKSIYG